MSNLGNRRSDRRAPRLPKDPEKRARDQRIRDYAAQTGWSIGSTRAMFDQWDEEAQQEGTFKPYAERCIEEGGQQ